MSIREGEKVKNVTKEVFLNTLACPTLGWLMRTMGKEAILGKPSLDQQFKMDQGLGVHQRARGLHSDGELVDEKNIAIAAEDTEKLMNNPNINVIMEGTFCYDGCVAKADVLKRIGEGWHLIEVKSNANDKDEFIDDLAYTATIIKRCGYVISKATLLLISKEFRLGMPDEKLFIDVNHTNEVLERVEVFDQQLETVVEITSREAKPSPELHYECKECEIFKECVGEGIENHIFELKVSNKLSELTSSLARKFS